MKLFSGSRSEQGRSDWVWRLTAFVVALALWISVGRESHLRTFIVPIHVQNGPATGQVEVDPERVSLKVSGDRATLNSVTMDDIHAYVDLRGKTGKQSAPIMVSLPTDVTVNEMAPLSVRIRLKGPVSPH